ncbi:Rnf-Nqr domain containing protein, partial [Glaesserella parasuis]
MQETQIPITQIEETTAEAKSSVWKNLFTQGVWSNNSTLVQLLGLCPLLAVSN